MDPALLRPGRMDMHIHMSYLTMHGFRILASNYLDISSDEHPHLFAEIESLLDSVNLTAAQVAEEILRIEDPETALLEVIKLLKQKKSEGTNMKVESVSSKKSIVDELGRKEKIVEDLETSENNEHLLACDLYLT